MRRIKLWAAAFIVAISLISVLIALGAMTPGSAWVLVGIIVIAAIFFAVKLVEVVVLPNRQAQEVESKENVTQGVPMETPEPPQTEIDPVATAIGKPILGVKILERELEIEAPSLFAFVEELCGRIDPDDVASDPVLRQVIYSEGRPLGFVLSELHTAAGTPRENAGCWQFNMRHWKGQSRLDFLAKLVTLGTTSVLWGPGVVGNLSTQPSESGVKLQVFSHFSHPEILNFFISLTSSILERYLGKEYADEWRANEEMKRLLQPDRAVATGPQAHKPPSSGMKESIVEDNTPKQGETLKRKARRGKKSQYSMSERDDAVIAWEELDKDIDPKTLVDFLADRFGENEHTREPLVAPRTFYEWREDFFRRNPNLKPAE